MSIMVTETVIHRVSAGHKKYICIYARIFFYILFRQMSKETSIEIKEFLILDQCFWYAFIGMCCLLVI